MVIWYIVLAITFLITMSFLIILALVRKKNDGNYIYFDGPFSVASIVVLSLSILGIIPMIVQQQKGLIGKEIYYLLIFLIPLIIFSFCGVLKTCSFRIIIRKKYVLIRSAFRKTIQFPYSQARYKRKWHIVFIIYYDGCKYWYFANNCITPGINQLYEIMKQVEK